jgi:two-component system response regulator RegX3
MSYRIVVVDDEPAIRDAVSYTLRSEGYDVEALATGEEALAAVESEPSPDLLVLDLMLPGLSGLEVCRRARAAGDIPILLLSARDSEVDRVVGLEAGADDYVTKPFSIAELVSRVRAIIRRRELDRASIHPVLRVGAIELDLTRHECRVDGDRVALTPSEFKVLALLAGEPERVFSRREIMQDLLGERLRRRPARLRHPRLEHPPEDRGRRHVSAAPADGARDRLQARSGVAGCRVCKRTHGRRRTHRTAADNSSPAGYHCCMAIVDTVPFRMSFATLTPHALVATISGELDAAAAQPLRSGVTAAARACGHTTVILELCGITFVDEDGRTAIADAAETLAADGGQLVLALDEVRFSRLLGSDRRLAMLRRERTLASAVQEVFRAEVR